MRLMQSARKSTPGISGGTGESASDEDDPTTSNAADELPEPETGENAESSEEKMQDKSETSRDENQERINVVVKEVVKGACSSRPCRGGVEESRWWSEVVQAIRELRDQVQTDSGKRDVRRAALRTKQEKLRACHKHDQFQAAKVAEIAEQIQTLTKVMSKHGLGVRNAAKDRQRRILQQSHLEVRKEYKAAIQDTKIQQDAVAAAVRNDAVETQAESQRLHWLRQLSLVSTHEDDGTNLREKAHGENPGDNDVTVPEACMSVSEIRQGYAQDLHAGVHIDRPHEVGKRARSIRFSPFEVHTDEDIVLQVLREGAHVRPYSERGAHADMTRTYRNVPYSATDGGVQVDLRSVVAERAPSDARSEDTSSAGIGVREDDHDPFASDKRGGILKGGAVERSLERSATPRPVSARSSSYEAFVVVEQHDKDATRLPRPRSASSHFGLTSSFKSRQTTSQGTRMASRQRPMSARPHSAGGKPGSTDTVGTKKRPRSAGSVMPTSAAGRRIVSSSSRAPFTNSVTMDSFRTDEGTILVAGRRTALRPHPPRPK